MKSLTKGCVLCGLAVVCLALFVSVAQAYTLDPLYVSGVLPYAEHALAGTDSVTGVTYEYGEANEFYPSKMTDELGRESTSEDHNYTSGEREPISGDMPWLIFDMGSSIALDYVDIYNYNEMPGRGVATMDVFWSNNATWEYSGGIGTITGGTFTSIANGVAVPEAPGDEDPWGPSLTLQLDVTAQFIRFNTLTNYDDENYTGLNEVEFNQVPEPSTLAMLGFGLAGALVLLAWRRRK